MLCQTKCWVVKSQESRLGIVENRDKNVMIDEWLHKIILENLDKVALMVKIMVDSCLTS
jgi:hypothetical protein